MKAFAPNGREIVATADTIPGNAHISDFSARKPDGSLDYDHGDETKMCWDGQVTTQDARGRSVFVDDRGNEWPEDAINLEGEPPRQWPPAMSKPASGNYLLSVAPAEFNTMLAALRFWQDQGNTPDCEQYEIANDAGRALNNAEIEKLCDRLFFSPAAPPSVPDGLILATYSHKHGTDSKIFLNAEAAEAWRQELADEYWDGFMNEAAPADPAAKADRYFQRSNELHDEYYSMEPCKIEGLPVAPSSVPAAPSATA